MLNSSEKTTTAKAFSTASTNNQLSDSTSSTSFATCPSVNITSGHGNTNHFSSAFPQSMSLFSSLGGNVIRAGAELLYEGISEEDKPLWIEMIRIGDDVAIHNVIKSKKIYLLTRTIGNPANPITKLLRNNEAHFGNTVLHSRMAGSHDESMIPPSNLTGDGRKLLDSTKKGADYLLRYYELKLDNAKRLASTKKQLKINQIQIAINAVDIYGKTSLLLACLTLNQAYALRLINLDSEKATLNKPDNQEQRTPLHIACILGMKELAIGLMNAGANNKLKDKYGHTAFYYLSCNDQEKNNHITGILDTVNFFYGRYFNNSQREDVIKTLVAKANELHTTLANMGFLARENGNNQSNILFSK